MRGGRRSSPYYPISLNLVGKRCVVVGGGAVALRKVKGLLERGASVEVISPDVCSELSELAEPNIISVKGRKYEPGDLDGAFIVIAATAESEANQEVANEARRRRYIRPSSR